MQDRRKWLVLGALIIAILGSLVLTYNYSSNRLSYVVDSYADNVRMIVIDDNGEKVSVLAAAPDGKITGGVYLNKKVGDTFAVLNYLNVDGSQVYVYKRVHHIISNRILSEGIYRCNFSRGNLELVWELPVIDERADQNAYGVKVAGGELTFITVETNPDLFAARAVLHKADLENTIPERIVAVDYDIGIGFNDFYYTSNGSLIFTTPDGRILYASAAEKQGIPVDLDDSGQDEFDGDGFGENGLDEGGFGAEPLGSRPWGDEFGTALLGSRFEEDAFGVEPPARESREEEFGAEPFGAEPPTESEFGTEPPTESRSDADTSGPEPSADQQEDGPAIHVITPDMYNQDAFDTPLQDLSLPEDELSMDLAQRAAEAGALMERYLHLEALPREQNIDNTGLLILDPVELLRTRLTNFTHDRKNTIYFMDLAKNGLYALDFQEGVLKSIINNWTDLRLTGGALVLPSDLKNLRFSGDDRFSATLSRDRETSVLAVFEHGQGEIFHEFTRASKNLWARGLLYFGGILLCFLLIYFLSEFFLIMTRGRVPIVTKMIAVFIPIVVLGLLLLQNMINNQSIKGLIDNQYKELFLISRQQVGAISPQLLAHIDLDNPYNQVYYYQLQQILTELPSESRLVGPGAKDEQWVYHFSYHWLHTVKDGELVSLICDQNYINVPIDYLYDRETTRMYYQAKDTGQIFRGDFHDVFGEWIVLVVPITDHNQNTVALLETGITKTALKYMVSENSKQIRQMILMVMGLLILLLSVILLRSLAPLKELKDKVQEIIDGHLGVQTSVRGRDEVAEIGQVFNQMSRSIEYHVNELTDLKDGYFRFVPSKLFQILRKNSVIDVHLGDQTQGAITILSFNAVDFDKIARTMTGEEMFGLINRIFSNLVPLVNDNGGVVDRFAEAGLVAFYTNGSEHALKTAVSVCQIMDQVNNREGFGKAGQIEMTNGISHGPVMIGIVGHEERLAATTVSEHTSMSGFLRKIGPKYSSRILTTAAVVNQTEGFAEKYNARFIGFLHIQASGTNEKLYDVFDGDPEDMRSFKKQTKELFEKGVNLYCTREFYEARLIFIEVLKRFREDGAAKEYLYLCDQYYQKEDTENIPIAIETY